MKTLYKHKKLTKLFSNHLYSNDFVSLPTNYKCNHVLPLHTTEKKTKLNITYNYVDLSAGEKKMILPFLL